jgi:hypothetical protein
MHVVAPCWTPGRKRDAQGQRRNVAVVAAGHETAKAREHERKTERCDRGIGQLAERDALAASNDHHRGGAAGVTAERRHAGPSQLKPTGRQQVLEPREQHRQRDAADHGRDVSPGHRRCHGVGVEATPARDREHRDQSEHTGKTDAREPGRRDSVRHCVGEKAVEPPQDVRSQRWRFRDRRFTNAATGRGRLAQHSATARLPPAW